MSLLLTHQRTMSALPLPVTISDCYTHGSADVNTTSWWGGGGGGGGQKETGLGTHGSEDVTSWGGGGGGGVTMKPV